VAFLAVCVAFADCVLAAWLRCIKNTAAMQISPTTNNAARPPAKIINIRFEDSPLSSSGSPTIVSSSMDIAILLEGQAR
jgi:hypothetical protein